MTKKSASGYSRARTPLAPEADGVAELANRPVTLGVVLLIVGSFAGVLCPITVYFFNELRRVSEMADRDLQRTESLKLAVEKLTAVADRLDRLPLERPQVAGDRRIDGKGAAPKSAATTDNDQAAWPQPPTRPAVEQLR